MRFALLIILLLAPVLSATSPVPKSPPRDEHGNIIEYSGEVKALHGDRFVYIRLYEKRPESPERRYWIVKGRLEMPDDADPPVTGLYRIGDYTKPVWEADLGGFDNLEVTDDAQFAAVFYDGKPAVLEFLRDGKPVGEEELTPELPLHVYSETSMRGHRLRYYEFNRIGDNVELTDRSGKTFVYSIELAEITRIYVPPPPSRDRLEELRKFEEALGRGPEVEEIVEPPPPEEIEEPAPRPDAEWMQNLPDGSEVFTSLHGTLTVVRVPAVAPEGPATICYNGEGIRLWSTSEALPRPVFLGDLMPTERIASYDPPIKSDFPLLIEPTCAGWALLQLDEKHKELSLRLGFDGHETQVELARTYEGDLKFSGARLRNLEGQRVTVDLMYGLTASERYRVDVLTGAVIHTTNFPEDEPEQAPGDTQFAGELGGPWLLVGIIAFLILVVGIFLGRVSRRT